MAEFKTIAVVPLNGGNYSTWKVQCRMALMKVGLWGLVSGTEAVSDTADRHAAYAARRDKVLAIIVLAIETNTWVYVRKRKDQVFEGFLE